MPPNPANQKAERSVHGFIKSLGMSERFVVECGSNSTVEASLVMSALPSNETPQRRACEVAEIPTGDIHLFHATTAFARVSSVGRIFASARLRAHVSLIS